MDPLQRGCRRSVQMKAAGDQLMPLRLSGVVRQRQTVAVDEIDERLVVQLGCDARGQLVQGRRLVMIVQLLDARGRIVIEVARGAEILMKNEMIVGVVRADERALRTVRARPVAGLVRRDNGVEVDLVVARLHRPIEQRLVRPIG